MNSLMQMGRPLFSRLCRRPVLAGGAVLALLMVGFLAWHGWGWYHFRAARNALDNRDSSAARRHIAKALQVWPPSAATYLLAARIARSTNQWKEAEDYQDDCLRKNGPAEEVILEQYLLRAQRGFVDTVEKKLLAFVNKDHPGTLLILDVLTSQWMAAYRFDQALAYLDLWLERRPGDREALIRKGWVLEHGIDISGAIAAYRLALAADPDKDRREEDRVRLRLGDLLLKQNRAPEASTHFEALFEHQPQNVSVLLGSARCRYLQGQVDEALILLDVLLKENPHEGQALGEKGRIALETGRLAMAEACLKQAAAACPFDRTIIFNFQRSLRKSGKLAEAQKYSLRLKQIRADEMRMPRLMNKLMKSPQDPTLCFEVGEIFLRNGMHQDGVKWLNLALVHDPWHAPAHRLLAEHFESLGKSALAAIHRQALGQNPAKEKRLGNR